MVYDAEDSKHVVKDIISASRAQQAASSSSTSSGSSSAGSSSSGSRKKADSDAEVAKKFAKEISMMKNFGRNVYK